MEIKKNERYDAINGLRAYSAIGIVMMHVLSNCEFKMDGFVYERLIPSFANLVFLFMIISAFSMCCGYYDKVLDNVLSIEQFYAKRYKRIWPYFSLLCIIDVIVSPSKEALYEAFSNMTLAFGLIPNADISVIGVGWFIGVVFVFYFVFPFYCYLIANKKRAWFVFYVTLLLNIVTYDYFGAERTSFIYDAVYFVAGGLIYLYRNEIIKMFKNKNKVLLLVCVISLICYFKIGANTYTMLLLFLSLLVYAICIEKKGILINPFTKLISDISMELYLSHMVIFRIIEKCNIIYLFGNNVISYGFTVVLTIIGTILFAIVLQRIINYLFGRFESIKVKHQ